MTDKDQSFSDFLNDGEEFDVEELEQQLNESSFSEEFSLGDAPSDSEKAGVPGASKELADDDPFEVTPTNILEGMLFVGNADNEGLSAEEMAGLMRGVSVDEIDDLVAELNTSYRDSNSPFEIVFEDEGYRLVLARGYEFCRQRFYREEKAATLSQSVVDVLALVAYLQPVTRKQIEAKKLKSCGSILSQLVRRRLIEIDRKTLDDKPQVVYQTTERFLELFGLDSLEELPQSQTFESPG